MSNYSEKLKDPRWQKKRLAIMARDEFTCQDCGATDKTLHVHHCRYEKDPWDVDDLFLRTLCEECHEQRGDIDRRALKAFQAIMAWSGPLDLIQIAREMETLRKEGCGGGPSFVDSIHLGIGDMELFQIACRRQNMTIRELYSEKFGPVDWEDWDKTSPPLLETQNGR